MGCETADGGGSDVRHGEGPGVGISDALVMVARQVLDGARGNEDVVGDAAGQIVTGIDGHGPATDRHLVAVRHRDGDGRSPGGVDGDGAAPCSHGLVKCQHQVRIHRHAGGPVMGCETADGGGSGVHHGEGPGIRVSDAPVMVARQVLDGPRGNEDVVGEAIGQIVTGTDGHGPALDRHLVVVRHGDGDRRSDGGLDGDGATTCSHGLVERQHQVRIHRHARCPVIGCETADGGGSGVPGGGIGGGDAIAAGGAIGGLEVPGGGGGDAGVVVGCGRPVPDGAGGNQYVVGGVAVQVGGGVDGDDPVQVGAGATDGHLIAGHGNGNVWFPAGFDEDVARRALLHRLVEGEGQVCTHRDVGGVVRRAVAVADHRRRDVIYRGEVPGGGVADAAVVVGRGRPVRDDASGDPHVVGGVGVQVGGGVDGDDPVQVGAGAADGHLAQGNGNIRVVRGAPDGDGARALLHHLVEGEGQVCAHRDAGGVVRRAVGGDSGRGGVYRSEVPGGGVADAGVVVGRGRPVRDDASGDPHVVGGVGVQVGGGVDGDDPVQVGAGAADGHLAQGNGNIRVVRGAPDGDGARALLHHLVEGEGQVCAHRDAGGVVRRAVGGDSGRGGVGHRRCGVHRHRWRPVHASHPEAVAGAVHEAGHHMGRGSARSGPVAVAGGTAGAAGQRLLLELVAGRAGDRAPAQAHLPVAGRCADVGRRRQQRRRVHRRRR